MKHRYDLEERCLEFASRVRCFVRSCPKAALLQPDLLQLVRSSGSVGANYIEANEALGKKDFLMRIRISKKESKECRYWLQLIDCGKALDHERLRLMQEAGELMCILGAILRNSGG